MAAAILTATRLRELLHYDPDTGLFTRLKTPKNTTIKVGDVAGFLSKAGYRIIKIDLKAYKAHRLAWLYMTGAFPSEETDHINGIKSDNQFINLREASHSLNAQNYVKPNADNKCGFLGVTKRASGKFVAQIRLMGEMRNLGQCDTPEEAHEVYLKAKRLLHPGCTI